MNLKAFENFRKEIVGLQSRLKVFQIDFLDRDSFKEFANRLWENIYNYTEVCITGYFSETVSQDLEKVAKAKDKKVKLICQELDTANKRDRKNLEVLKKLCKAGVEVRFNNRIHARLLIAYHPQLPESSGLLILGSFDFNSECIGRERYDAGIRTRHPDLIEAAIHLFEEIWNDSESIPLNEKCDSK